MIIRSTPATCGGLALLAWHDTNWDKLVFDGIRYLSRKGLVYLWL